MGQLGRFSAENDKKEVPERRGFAPAIPRQYYLSCLAGICTKKWKQQTRQLEGLVLAAAFLLPMGIPSTGLGWR